MFYIVDGSGFVFRAFHALPPLTTKNGTPIGAVFGFCQMIKNLNQDKILVVFDKDGSTFRKNLYPDYKANRTKPPEELIIQFPIIKDACRAFGLDYVERSGFEADDIIASYVKLAKENVTIISSDKDLMQLVSHNVFMFDPIKKITIDEKYVLSKLGVLPNRVTDYLGLIGDSSDNIPGVPGIGPKTAVKLLEEFESIEGIIKNCNLISSKRLQDKIIEFKDQALLSKQLATLLYDVPIDLSINNITRKEFDPQFFQELGFQNIIKTSSIKTEPIRESENFEPESFITIEHKEQKIILTTRVKGEIISKSFDKLPNSLNEVLKVGYKIKLREPFEDIDVLAYVLNEKIDVNEPILISYEKLRNLLVKNKKVDLYENIERPLVQILKNMEDIGIKIDKNELLDLKIYFEKNIKELEKGIFEIAGYEFNPSSPKQVAKALFEDLKCPSKGKGKSGVLSTDYDVLESLIDEGYKIAELLLRHRELSKLKSTYVDGLLKHEKNEIIQTTFSQTDTLTGRLSSNSPNLQNIPVRTEEGRKIRHCFIPRENKTFYSFDYSQIELRLLAHFADIKELKDAFENKQDIHKITASKVFGTNEVTTDQRRIAKIINFGILYGISPHGLAKQIHTSREEASKIIETYFKSYPGVLDFMKEKEEEAKKFGYVKTLFGRSCFLPDIYSSNAIKRNFAKRQAINAPLQGSNADIIKRAMVRLKPFLNNVSLLLQVHDELLFEIDDKNLDFVPKIKLVMELCDELSVPLEVSVKKGKRWDELN